MRRECCPGSRSAGCGVRWISPSLGPEEDRFGSQVSRNETGEDARKDQGKSGSVWVCQSITIRRDQAAGQESATLRAAPAHLLVPRAASRSLTLPAAWRPSRKRFGSAEPQIIQKPDPGGESPPAGYRARRLAWSAGPGSAHPEARVQLITGHVVEPANGGHGSRGQCDRGQQDALALAGNTRDDDVEKASKEQTPAERPQARR